MLSLALYEQWHPNDVLIEDAASGQSLLQELRTTLLPISGVKPDGDKFARAASITPAMDGGHFWVLEGASWSVEYLAEMTAFPGAAHDDFVDATVQALSFLRQPPEQGIIGFYRNQVIAASTGITDAFAEGRELVDIYENTRLQIEAGYCRRCHTSLFQKAAVDDGLGQLCIPVPSGQLEPIRTDYLNGTNFPAQQVEQGTKFPVHAKKFPARLSREFVQKARRTKRLCREHIAQHPLKSENSLQIPC